MKRIGEVLDALVAEGLVSEADINLKNESTIENPSPWYIQGLMGLGGWLAALFFFSCVGWFVILTLNMNSEFANGLALSVIGAIFLLATTSHILAGMRPNLFIEQFRLVLHIVGHLALLTGITIGLQLYRLEYFLAVYGCLLLVLMGTFIWLYPDGIFRFLAGIALVVGLNLIIFDFLIVGSLSLFIGVLGFVLFLIFGGLLPAKQELAHFELLQALPYGLVFGFFGTILHQLSFSFYYGREVMALYQPELTSVLLLLVLFWMLIRLMTSYQIKISSPSALFILGLVLLIAIPTLNTPGTLAGILVVLLAFRRRNWLLLGLAYAFLAYFTVYFYYTLNLSLDLKSYILMGTGLALLLGRMLLQRVLPKLENTEVA